MIADSRVLAVVPARAGSRGLRNKNVLPFGGRPLIEWTLDAAQGSGYIDMVVVSTDDVAVSRIAANHDVRVLDRPAELAADETPAAAVVEHALASFQGFDVLVYLQPTSPLRTARHIDDCLEQLIASGSDGVATVRPVVDPPEWMYRMHALGQLVPILDGQRADRRQDLAQAYVLNGAVYCARVSALSEHFSFGRLDLGGMIMGLEESADIDTRADFEAAEAAFLATAMDRRSGAQ